MARRTFLQLTGAAAGAALLAGCGERAASTAESGTELMVTVLMPGQSDETACVRISAALSEVTKQKLGFGVSIEQVAPTNYSAELWKRMVCQTMPDLFFLTENQPLDVYLNQNCILPLSALLEERPGLKALFSEQQWASRTYYRHLYGFDRPVIVQYLSWIGGLFRGTMGQSISYQSEIADIILPRLGTTLTMVIPAFIIGTITGILFGIIAAKNRGKVIDSVISFFANIGVSMPMFWLGMMGMLVFALKLRVLPSSGYVPITRDFGGWLSHMIMPIIVLSLGVNAGFVRLTRSSMLEVMRQDYVTTARAKGVSKKDVTFRHQLRNSMIPIVTTMGMRLGSMVGSTVLIESLFVIPGLGSVMMNGISNRDFMLVANGVLIISIFVAICNLVVDILYGIIDPRTR